MFSFLIKTYYPGPRSFWSKKQEVKARDLLGSIANDTDLVLDWWFLYDVLTDDNISNVPDVLRITHIVFTIMGTFTWLFLSSDGRAVSWFVIQPFLMCSCICLTFCGDKGCVKQKSCLPVSQLWTETTKTSDIHDTLKLSTGFLLLCGVLIEDLPQIILSFLVKSWLEPEDGQAGGILNGAQLSGLVVANLLTSIYNALIKLADAYDQREDIVVIETEQANGSGNTAATFEKSIRKKIPTL